MTPSMVGRSSAVQFSCDALPVESSGSAQCMPGANFQRCAPLRHHSAPLPPAPQSMPGICCASSGQSSMDQSLQALNDALQEFIMNQFMQLTKRVDFLSNSVREGRDAVQEEVTHLKEQVRSLSCHTDSSDKKEQKQESCLLSERQQKSCRASDSLFQGEFTSHQATPDVAPARLSRQRCARDSGASMHLVEASIRHIAEGSKAKVDRRNKAISFARKDSFEADADSQNSRKSISSTGSENILPVSTDMSSYCSVRSSRNSNSSSMVLGNDSMMLKSSGSFKPKAVAANEELIRMVASQIEKDADKSQSLLARDGSRTAQMRRLWRKAKHGPEEALDSVMGMLILANTVSIGASLDHSGPFWISLDIFFSVSFQLELLMKLCLLGFQGHFCGHSPLSNGFDFFLIVVDALQLIMQYLLYEQVGKSMEDTPSASMFRIFRLVRLVRLLRILRLPVFQELISLVTGMIGGMRTLTYAIGLFVLVVYVVSLLFREFFGRKPKEHITEYFDSVPRSMFTVFRCAFGDCSTSGGIPIFEWVQVEYGVPFTLVYCFFVFVVGIGLFNVISAIFVESTLSAASANSLAVKQERLADADLWRTRVTVLIIAFMDFFGRNRAPMEAHAVGENLIDQMDTIFEIEVGPEDFDEWSRDERVSKAFHDLDINPDDHAYLFKILDCDNSGGLFLTEILDGVMRLRGEPRRSDIITIDLMVRVIQNQCNLLVAGMETLTKRISVGDSDAEAQQELQQTEAPRKPRVSQWGDSATSNEAREHLAGGRQPRCSQWTSGSSIDDSSPLGRL